MTANISIVTAIGTRVRDDVGRPGTIEKHDFLNGIVMVSFDDGSTAFRNYHAVEALPWQADPKHYHGVGQMVCQHHTQ